MAQQAGSKEAQSRAMLPGPGVTCDCHRPAQGATLAVSLFTYSAEHVGGLEMADTHLGCDDPVKTTEQSY